MTGRQVKVEDFYYKAYGLLIRSSLELPGLPSCDAGDADVVIRRGRVERDRGDVIASGECFEVTGDGAARLFWEGAGGFMATGGSEVVVDPAPGAGEAVLRHFLMGAVMGVILHQRGELVLHASSVAIDGAAVAFLGDQGLGKSTLAAAMHAAGGRLVTDDVAAVRIGSGGPPEVIPGAPFLKLWPEPALALGYDYETCERVEAGSEKRLVPAMEGLFCGYPTALSRLYVLDCGDALDIAPLEGQGVFMELLKNSFCAGLLSAGGSASPHFFQSSALARAVPARRLMIPRRLSALSEAVQMIKDDIAANAHG